MKLSETTRCVLLGAERVSSALGSQILIISLLERNKTREQNDATIALGHLNTLQYPTEPFLGLLRYVRCKVGVVIDGNSNEEAPL